VALVELLRRRNQLTSTAKQACCDALELLQEVFDSAPLTGTGRDGAPLHRRAMAGPVAYEGCEGAVQTRGSNVGFDKSM
jgi:hypothetical protein